MDNFQKINSNSITELFNTIICYSELNDANSYVEDAELIVALLTTYDNKCGTLNANWSTQNHNFCNRSQPLSNIYTAFSPRLHRDGSYHLSSLSKPHKSMLLIFHKRGEKKEVL